MAELFKENLSLNKIITLGSRIAEQSAGYELSFDQQIFQQKLTEFCIEQGESDWQLLSLMQRLRAAAQALHSTLPENDGAKAAVSALYANEDLSGWLSLVCCEYIAIHQGLSLEQGLSYLQQMTEFFSAEFAIRHFILKQPQASLAILTSWLEHDNHHIRRLVSEGTRPRLPWGVRLPIFIEQPELVVPLLTALRDDEEEYVRRSVANHLNDIAKDNPQLIIEIAQQWLALDELEKLTAQQRKQRTKLIRHACRTLFKQGLPEIMALFGYLPAEDVQCSLSSQQLTVPFGGDFEFELLLDKSSNTSNLLMVDYIVNFQKANGKQAPKVFKWLDRSFTTKVSEQVKRKHSFKKISTRKYYHGAHRLDVIVNGIKKAQIEFELLEKNA